jgi:protein phosphatase
MLRVAEQYAVTDTGRQRRENEDALLARSPLFVVADGMGGAQAGEVASKIAVEAFQSGLEAGASPEQALASRAQEANASIHSRSHANAEQAGMGTTLTAVYVGEEEISVAHVGDSRAYCLREGELIRLTDDHSLVDELLRQGRLTPEEAVEHPQRSVITRALGPELTVDVDTRSFRGRAGDVYLLCSDGLTTMVSEEEIASLLIAHESLRDAGEALVAAANDAGGRDNITVVLLRLEELEPGAGSILDEHVTLTGVPAVTAAAVSAADAAAAESSAAPRGHDPAPRGHDPAPRAAVVPPPAAAVRRRVPRRGPARAGEEGRHRRRRRIAVSALAALAVLALFAGGAYLAMQSVYFIGTNSRGLITLYQGVPYQLPGSLALYRTDYVSGVSASSLNPARRRTLLDHSLRSEANAAALLRSLELGEVE